jgi:RimJ/RimL family protein N-acetyltransferase
MSSSAKDPRIKLRKTAESDLEHLFKFQRDPEAIRMAAFTPEDPSDRQAYMNKWRKLLASQEVCMRSIVVEEELAGSVLSFVMDGEREITYWLDRAFWGRGIGSVALKLFLQEEERRPLWARAAIDNHGSIRVLEKNGFERVAQERGYAHGRKCEVDEFVYRLDE